MIKSIRMSENKKTVEKYMEAFGRSDHAEILSCLTEDVEWIIPGHTHRKGKNEFDQEIENDQNEGSPQITVTRLIEENNIVVAEGKVSQKLKNGGEVNLVFCDVFEMNDAKIQKLISYLSILK
jgi:ketosteroid isomerase-like protein